MEIISEMNPLDSVIKGNGYYCDSPILYQCRRYLRHCKILATIEELTAMYGRSECIYIQVFLKETLAQVGLTTCRNSSTEPITLTKNLYSK